jgi:hypothetical protein
MFSYNFAKERTECTQEPLVHTSLNYRITCDAYTQVYNYMQYDAYKSTQYYLQTETDFI